MDFMPSIVRITKTNSESYQYNEEDFKRIKSIDEKLRENYDVIIYDCQAGYTDVLKLLLPYVDVNLVVMEADAISSAAIRSFYLKIGDLLNEKKYIRFLIRQQMKSIKFIQKYLVEQYLRI